MKYNDIMHLLETEARLLQIPFVGNFELTYHCNLKCAFCYASARCEQRSELSGSQWKRIFAELSSLGLTRATFTGGEIFTRPDTLELYCFAYDLGMRLTLLTNGILITEDVCRVLSRRKPEGVSISVYGASPADYLAITGDAEGFSSLKKSLSYLRQYDIPTSLKTIALPALRHRIEDIRSFASKEDLKITLTKYVSPTPQNFGPDFRLPAEEIAGLSKHFDNANDIMGGVQEGNSRCAISDCNAGKGRIAINPYGEMMGCICYPEIKIPIQERPCEDVLADLREALSAQRNVCKDCESCPYTETCGKCGGLNYMETGATFICSSYRKALARYNLI